jgi:hypothetical protein
VGIRLPLVAMFESTTVRALAARVALPGEGGAEVSASFDSPDVAGRAERQRGAAAWNERNRLARGLARPSPEEE